MHRPCLQRRLLRSREGTPPVDIPLFTEPQSSIAPPIVYTEPQHPRAQQLDDHGQQA